MCSEKSRLSSGTYSLWGGLIEIAATGFEPGEARYKDLLYPLGKAAPQKKVSNRTTIGSGCSTAVEHTPRDREVVAFFSSLPYPMKCLRNQVPRGGATLLIFLFKNIHA